MLACENIDENTEQLKKMLASDDVAFTPVIVGEGKGTLVFCAEITDKTAIGELILRPALKIKGKPTEKTVKEYLLSPEAETETDLLKVAEKVANGFSALIVNGISSVFLFGLKKSDKRAITEPPTSTVIKGPREGFVESLSVNMSLMRRRLCTPDLVFKYIKVGEYSKTQVALCYIRGLADERLINAVTEKLRSVKTDAVLDSSYISKFLGERKTSLFKQTGNTEKPDILAARILEGRIAIISDGSPIALTLPYLIIEDFQSPSDYYASPYSATLARSLRFLAVSIAVFLPAFFVSAELFHLQLIPLSFLLTIVNSIKGIPLSPSLEMFFTLLIFEILNEASVRMPKYVGMVVSIVGGLVLGETAVNAGIISAPALMIIALSGICLYTVPELEQTMSLIRLIFLVIGGSFGAFGILVGAAAFLTYLVSFENYGTPVTAPLSPLIVKDLKDSVYKGFLSERKGLPLSLKNAVKKVKND